MKYFGVFFLILSLQFSQAQNKKVIDSLTKVYHTTKEDTAKVLLLVAITSKYGFSKPDTCITIAQRILQKSQKITFARGKAEGLYYLGFAHFAKGDFTISLQHIEKSLDVFQQINDRKGLMKVFLLMGSLYLKKGNYPMALENHQKSLTIAKSLEDKRVMALNTGALANIYSGLGELNLALKYYRKSLEAFKKLDDSINIARALNGIGKIYSKQNKLDKALTYYKKSLKISRRLGYKRELNIILNNIASIYEKEENYPLALEYYQECLTISEALGDKVGISYVYQGIANIARKQQNYQASIEYALKGLKVAKEMGALRRIKEMNLVLYKTYKVKGDYLNALKYYERYKQNSDSLFNIEKSKAITNLETQAEIANKEKEIAILNKNKELLEKDNRLQKIKAERQKWQFIILITLFGILIISGGFIWRIRMIKRQNNLKYELINANLKVLKTQMNPHFIFNSLISIQSFMLEKKSENAKLYLNKFAKLTRLILEASRQDYISIADELSILNNYLVLEHTFIDNKFEYTFTIDENIDVEQFKIPPLFTQTFIENAIKHGVSQMKTGGKIHISFSLENKLLLISITDNGIGRKQAETLESIKKYRSLATEITTERIEFLQQAIGKNIRLEIEDVLSENKKIAGTKVKLFLPYKNQ